MSLSLILKRFWKSIWEYIWNYINMLSLLKNGPHKASEIIYAPSATLENTASYIGQTLLFIYLTLSFSF